MSVLIWNTVLSLNNVVEIFASFKVANHLKSKEHFKKIMITDYYMSVYFSSEVYWSIICTKKNSSFGGI